MRYATGDVGYRRHTRRMTANWAAFATAAPELARIAEARFGAFTHHAGEMTLAYAAGVTSLQLDVDGDGVTDYRMKISGDVHLDSGGWLL